MFGIIHFDEFLAAVLLMVINPGPNSLYIFSLATQKGKKTAYWGIGGIAMSDFILLSFVTFSAAYLITIHPDFFKWAQYLCAAYLTWLGVHTLYMSLCQFKKIPIMAAETAVIDEKPFIKGLLINTLNPQAILFPLAVFIPFVEPNYPHPALSFSLLGITLQLINISYLILFTYLGSQLKAFLKNRHWIKPSIESGSGILFIYFGLRLAIAT